MPVTPLNIATGVDPAAAEAAYDKLRQINEAFYAREKSEREKHQKDLATLSEEGASSAVKFQVDSTTAQIREMERLSQHRKAFSTEFLALQKEIDSAKTMGYAHVDPEDLWASAPDKLEKYKEGLKAKLSLFESHQKELEKVEAERAERSGKIVGLASGVVGAAGSALARTSQGTEAEGIGTGIGGAVASIASSKNTWEAILNTTKGILDITSSLYSSYLRRTQQQLQIAFAYMDPGRFPMQAPTNTAVGVFL